MHIEYYGLVHEHYNRCILHVTGLVQDNGTVCVFACYWRFTTLLIVTVDKEHHILSYSFLAILFSDSCSFCSNLILLVSAVLSSLSFFSIDAVQFDLGLEMLRSFAVLLAALLPRQLGPNICRYSYNMFLPLPNSYTITKYCALWHTVI